MLIQALDTPGAAVSFNVFHLRVDDLAVVAGGVQHAPVAAVHSHVGYGMMPTALLEEDQVATLEVGPGYPLAVLVPILFDRMIWELLAEVPEDEMGEARAVFLAVSPAGRGRREAVGGAQMFPAISHHGPALVRGARGGVNAPAAFGRRDIRGRLGGDAPDERYSIGDDPARVALRRDAHDVSVTSTHLVGADLNPGTPVSGLVNLCPSGAAGGGLHAEAGGLGVALPGRPPGVEGIVALRGDLELEARVRRAGGVGARRDEAAPVGQAVFSAPRPSLGVKTLGIRVVHHLRIVGEQLLLGYVLMNCAELGPGCPCDGALRDGRSGRLRLDTTVRCVGLRCSREGY